MNNDNHTRFQKRTYRFRACRMIRLCVENHMITLTMGNWGDDWYLCSLLKTGIISLSILYYYCSIYYTQC